jgi:hypothetical protein
MRIPNPTIALEEAAQLLRKIAAGQISVSPSARRIADVPDALILCAGSYSLYLFEDDDGLGSLERLAHQDGRTGDIEGWLATTGQVPQMLLTEAERMWLDAILAVAQTLGPTLMIV